MNMKLHCLLCLLLSANLVLAEDSKQDIKGHKEATTTGTPQMIFSNYEDLKWNRILPALGENSRSQWMPLFGCEFHNRFTNAERMNGYEIQIHERTPQTRSEPQGIRREGRET